MTLQDPNKARQLMQENMTTSTPPADLAKKMEVFDNLLNNQKPGAVLPRPGVPSQPKLKQYPLPGNCVK